MLFNKNVRTKRGLRITLSGDIPVRWKM